MATWCYDRLSRIVVNEEGEAARCLEAIALTRAAAPLSRLGEVDKAEYARSRGREAAVGVGSIDLLILSAKVNAEIQAMTSGSCTRVQSRAFAHRISRWGDFAGKDTCAGAAT